MSRAATAEWHEVGSEIEALLREAALIADLQPVANVQVGAPALASRAIPGALVRDAIVFMHEDFTAIDTAPCAVMITTAESGSCSMIRAR